MPRHLYTVEYTFLLKDRGLVTAPGIVPREGERFRIGDRVEIRRPDGSRLAWAIGGIEMSDSTPPTPGAAILLRDLGKEDVPIGSEIWSIDG